MRTIEEINTILRQDDERTEKLFEGTDDYLYDGKQSGRKKMLYHLKKFGITLDEWYFWLDN